MHPSLLLTTALASAWSLDLSTTVKPDGSYDVFMDGVHWLASPADVAPVVAGNTLKILRHLNTTGTEAGLGKYHGNAVEWGTETEQGSGEFDTLVITEILTFGGSVVFRQRWPQGLQNTSITCGEQPVSKSQNLEIHGFPQFSMVAQTESMQLNAVSFGGNQISTTAVIPWSADHKQQQSDPCGKPGQCCSPNATVAVTSISRSRDNPQRPNGERNGYAYQESALPNGPLSSAPAPPVCASAVVENNTDYKGNDLICYSPVKSIAACCELCAVNSNCIAISFGAWRPTGILTCFLKTSAQHKTTRPGHQSLVIPGKQLPTPPPTPPAPTPFLDAGSGLPLLLFNKSLHSLVVSPITNFFTAVHTTRHCDAGSTATTATTTGPPNQCMRAGIKCSVRSLPANFTHDTILHAGVGLQSTMLSWGDILLARGGKTRVDPYKDLVLSNVGYWTDHGAAYYGSHRGFNNSEDALKAVQVDAKQRGVPLNYYQWDDWWFSQAKGGDAGGLVDWQPRADVFPSGLTNWMNAPLSLYMATYSSKNIYINTTRNYSWAIDSANSQALPTSADFYRDLFLNGTK
jgi:hypothetical protein